MSRIGRKPIPVPDGVTVTIEPEAVHVTGPRGALSERIHRDIGVEQGEDGVAADVAGAAGDEHGFSRHWVCCPSDS